MRLTLRTLLAYLDDILEPAQARLIGAKIAESGMAQDLVGRIREVMRRRRLLAPDVDGPGMGVDPNLIAEYLDNALSNEDVTDIERVCLESDMHLAEVTASHQILTLVLGEPVAVVPRSRERMYALGPISRKAADFASAESATEPPKSTVSAPRSPVAPPPEPKAPVASSRPSLSSMVGPATATTAPPSAARPDSARPDTTRPEVVRADVTRSDGAQAAVRSSATGRDDASRTNGAPTSPKANAAVAGGGSAGSPPGSASVTFAGASEAVAPGDRRIADPFATSAFDSSARSPEPHRTDSRWRRSLPWVVVGVLAIVFAALLATDPAFRQKWQGDRLANRSPSATEDGQSSSNDDPGKSAVPPAENGDLATTSPDADNAATTSAAAASGKPPVVASRPERNGARSSIDPPPPPEPGDTKPPQKNGAETAPPASDDVVAAPPPPRDGKPTPPGEKSNPVAEPPAAKPAQAVAAKLDYVSPEGVLLRHDVEQKDWSPLPRRSVLQPGDAVAAPEPFDSVISINKGRLIATLVGGSVVQFLDSEPPFAAGFVIRQGRVLLQTRGSGAAAANAAPKDPAGKADEGGEAAKPPDGKAGAENDDPADAKPAIGPAAKATVVALVVGKDRWVLEISDDTLCAIEIVPREPDTIDQDFARDGWSGRLAVVAGAARAIDAEGRGFAMTARTSLALHPRTATPPDLAVLQDADMPRWIDLGAHRVITRRIATQFEGEFEMGRGVTQYLPTVVGSQKSQISELAAKALGLTGNPAALVRALGASIHKETRVAAIVGLRQWLGESPKNGEALIAECERVFPSGDDRIVYEMLWGFSQDDARDTVKSAELVGRLEHDQLAIRELAYFHLKRITGLSTPYDAQMPANQRATAANRFRTHLRKEGGTLLKPVANPE